MSIRKAFFNNVTFRQSMDAVPVRPPLCQHYLSEHNLTRICNLCPPPLSMMGVVVTFLRIGLEFHFQKRHLVSSVLRIRHSGGSCAEEVRSSKCPGVTICLHTVNILGTWTSDGCWKVQSSGTGCGDIISACNISHNKNHTG